MTLSPTSKSLEVTDAKEDENENPEHGLILEQLDEKRCAICQEIIIKACRVSCGHEFCRLCIDRQREGDNHEEDEDKDEDERRSNPNGYQKCIVCFNKINEVQNVPELDKEIDTLFSRLPTNERLDRAAQKAQRQRKTDAWKRQMAIIAAGPPPNPRRPATSSCLLRSNFLWGFVEQRDRDRTRPGSQQRHSQSSATLSGNDLENRNPPVTGFLHPGRQRISHPDLQSSATTLQSEIPYPQRQWSYPDVHSYYHHDDSEYLENAHANFDNQNQDYYQSNNNLPEDYYYNPDSDYTVHYESLNCPHHYHHDHGEEESNEESETETETEAFVTASENATASGDANPSSFVVHETFTFHRTRVVNSNTTVTRSMSNSNNQCHCCSHNPTSSTSSNYLYTQPQPIQHGHQQHNQIVQPEVQNPYFTCSESDYYPDYYHPLYPQTYSFPSHPDYNYYRPESQGFVDSQTSIGSDSRNEDADEENVQHIPHYTCQTCFDNLSRTPSCSCRNCIIQRQTQDQYENNETGEHENGTNEYSRVGYEQGNPEEQEVITLMGRESLNNRNVNHSVGLQINVNLSYGDEEEESTDYEENNSTNNNNDYYETAQSNVQDEYGDEIYYPTNAEEFDALYARDIPLSRIRDGRVPVDRRIPSRAQLNLNVQESNQEGYGNYYIATNAEEFDELLRRDISISRIRDGRGGGPAQMNVIDEFVSGAYRNGNAANTTVLDSMYQGTTAARDRDVRVGGFNYANCREE